MKLDALSPDTGAYCKARKRLPKTLLSRLAKRIGQRLSDKAGDDKLWLGRRVKVVDGSSASMVIPGNSGDTLIPGTPY